MTNEQALIQMLTFFAYLGVPVWVGIFCAMPTKEDRIAAMVLVVFFSGITGAIGGTGALSALFMIATFVAAVVSFAMLLIKFTDWMQKTE